MSQPKVFVVIAEETSQYMPPQFLRAFHHELDALDLVALIDNCRPMLKVRVVEVAFAPTTAKVDA